MNGFNASQEIRRSVASQCLTIQRNAWSAIDRLYWMHAVGSGICGCGSDIQGHSLWDNHGPVEMPIDKSADVLQDNARHHSTDRGDA